MDTMGSEESLSSAVADLLNRPYSQLTEVEFGSNTFSTECMASIAQAEWPRLKELQLKTDAPGLAAMQMLAQAEWPLLESLRLIHLRQYYTPYKHGSKPLGGNHPDSSSTEANCEAHGSGDARGNSGTSVDNKRHAVLNQDGKISDQDGQSASLAFAIGTCASAHKLGCKGFVTTTASDGVVQG